MVSSPMRTWKPHQNWKANGPRFGAEKSTPCICRSLRTTCINSIRRGCIGCTKHFSCRSLTACRVFCLCWTWGYGSRAFLKTGPKFYQGNHGKSAIFPYKSTPLWSWKPVLGILCWLHDQGCSFHFRYVAFFIPEVLKIANIQANEPAIITILSARVAGASPSFRTASTTFIPQHHRTRCRIPTSSKWWRGKMKEMERDWKSRGRVDMKWVCLKIVYP